MEYMLGSKGRVGESRRELVHVYAYDWALGIMRPRGPSRERLNAV